MGAYLRGWTCSFRGRLGLVEWNAAILADKGMQNSEKYIDCEPEFIAIDNTIKHKQYIDS